MALHTVNVIVEHDYKATDDQELTIKKGDIIRSVEQKVGGWWRGELRGRYGLFPDNFVRLLDSSHDPNDAVMRNTPRYCRALFSYQQANPDELNLSVGDVIQVHGEVEEGWWRGQTGNHLGVFPSNFVVPMENVIVPPILPPKPVREQCKVLFPYTAANSDELTLAEGDYVTIVSRDVADQGWWRGELRGRVGLFPDNFVTVLPLHDAVSASDTANKKPSRPSKSMSSLSQIKNQPMSSHRKDTSLKSGSQENVATARKSLEVNDANIIDTNSLKSKKSTDAVVEDSNIVKTRRSIEPEPQPANDTKSRRSLDVEGANKPPVPVKKAGSPVAAMFSGLRQKVLAVEHRLSSVGHQQTDTPDGSAGSKPSSDPVLISISPSPSPIPTSTSPAPIIAEQNTSDSFDQIERNSMLNDPRAGRVKAPRRRLPSQATKDDPPLTNGSSNHNSSTESGTESEIKPKAREWEKHKAPWMEELKLNQAKKTSPIAEIGRSKTISTTDSNLDSKNDLSHARLSGSSDKIIESGETESNKETPLNPLEMSQSMTAISTKIIKIEKSEEVQGHTENPLDMSKSMSSLSSRVSHVESNSKVSPNELRTSISSSASVVLRSTTHLPAQPIQNSVNSGPQLIMKEGIAGMKPMIHTPIEEENNFSIHPPSNGMVDSELTSQQLLISTLNERVANLERVVEAQEAKFTAAIAALTSRLARETDMRCELQAEIQKLERCVTRV
ncbi:CIN85 and CD2AP related [Arctopsyche grandis]|uniref:CIN85 and CD2AP related n=1 Tax=Arctopsyche grandis TaxID=121162 RepID=UPI00406D6F48